VLKRDLPRDAVITYDDVTLPSGRLIDALREEQLRHFGAPEHGGAAGASGTSVALADRNESSEVRA
jgi:hypothetical protein